MKSKLINDFHTLFQCPQCRRIFFTSIPTVLNITFLWPIQFLFFLLIAICTSQFRNEFEQLFGEILWRSRCSVIRTSILEVALALSFAGLPLNGFNFDKVCGGLLATSVEANKLSDTATTTTASEASIAIWRPLEAKVQSQLQLLRYN